MAITKRKDVVTAEQRMRQFAVERAKPPQSDPTGAHHAACRQIADEAGRDVVEVIEHWGERAAVREHVGGMSFADAEAAAVEDTRQFYVKQSAMKL